MMRLLLNSGLTSVGLWIALSAFAIVFLSWLRHRNRKELPQISRLGRILLGSLLFVGTLGQLGQGLYKGYIAPNDLLQDIVSADEYLAGRSLYPDDMNLRMRALLEREPPRPSLFSWSPTLHAYENRVRDDWLSYHWVQAHPPFMSLVVAVLLLAFGVLGVWIVLAGLTLVGLTLTLGLAERGLDLRLSRWHLLLLMLALLSWDPIVDVCRSGQFSVVLGALMVAGWYALKRGRPGAAGVAVGVASCLKLYPALLLFYFLLRSRRAFVAAVVTILAITAGTMFLTGPETFAEYRATTQGVTREYSTYPNNLSLLSFLVRTIGRPAETWPLAFGLFLALAFVLIAGVAWTLRNCRSATTQESRTLDEEYALFMVLMVLLSPVSWDHSLSILIFPLLVLGRHALTIAAPWRDTFGFLALVVVFAIPDTSFTILGEVIPRGTPHYLVHLFWLSLRTYALLVLTVWLTRFCRASEATLSTTRPLAA
jgi:hypothetical protein